MAQYLIVAGPTASGKSAIGVSLAQCFGGEVVNIDSVQLYKDLSIGSAKISLEQRQGIPHHLLDALSPAKTFDVAKYIRLAEQTAQEIQNRDKLPIFVGGTSLYISSLLHGLVDLPPSDHVLRADLEQRSVEDLYTELQQRDPETARTLHSNDKVRIVRAVEASIMTQNGDVSVKRKSHRKQEDLHQALIVVPMWPRSELYDRIDKRSKEMIDNGLVQETQMLIRNYGLNAPALKSIGYLETLQYLSGKLTPQQLVDEISQSTRRFAKRQMTWLRNEPMKKGWDIVPSDDSGIVLEGDTNAFAHPKRLRHFRVLTPSLRELAQMVTNELELGLHKTKVLFVDARVVLENKA